jgi:hypothetical protein
MYSYLFTDQADKKPAETFIGNQPAGFITFGDGDPIDWTKFDHVNGEVVAIPEPEPAPEPVPYIPTAAEIQNQLTNAVQSYMDKKAQEIGYDNLISVITYADEPTVAKFESEGKAFRQWRSLVWAKCYEILLEVQNETRPIPTELELITELPVLGGDLSGI